MNTESSCPVAGAQQDPRPVQFVSSPITLWLSEGSREGQVFVQNYGPVVLQARSLPALVCAGGPELPGGELLQWCAGPPPLGTGACARALSATGHGLRRFSRTSWSLARPVCRFQLSAAPRRGLRLLTL